jgi:DNA-binding transcriptional LysR family regulator
MDLRYVYTFYRAATLKSITAAAAELRIVPGAAAKRIRELENDLDVTLLDRRPDKQFRLTAAGTRFLLDAAQLMALWGEARQRVAHPASLSRPLRLGAIESVLHSWLIPWLESLRREQPQLALELTVETTAALLRMMREGTLDVVAASLPVQEDGVSTRELPSMPMVFAGGAALSATRKHTLPELARRELLTFQRNSQPHLALLDQLRTAGLEGTRVHAISSIAAIMRLAAGGFGVATLPRGTVDRLGPKAEIHALRCSAALAPLPIYLSWLVMPGTKVLDAIVDHATAFSALQ